MISDDVKLGNNVKIPYPDLVNLYGCEIGDDVFIGPFVEIQKGAKVGAKTRVSSHSFICEGVEIGEDCFIAHGVVFVNDKFTEEKGNWIMRGTKVGNKVRIGSNVTILPVEIGDNAILGAGSVVTKSVPASSVVIGNPARSKEKARAEVKNGKGIPFLDLGAQYETIKDDVKKEIDWILDNGSFVLGEKVKSFEDSFAKYCGRGHAVALNSGTSALHLALLASGVGAGDEVITVPNTFIATAEAISYVGARPVFVEVNEDDYMMNVSKIQEKITPKTKAIIPVHLYGHPCDMDPILDIAKKYNLTVIEDCCQAHGAEYKGKRVPISGLGCFSFYPGKNLGAYGEGGAVVTDDAEKANFMKTLREHGQEKKYIHRYIGYNYRMEGIQGAVLGVKLKHLDKWTEARRKKVELYNSLLKDTVKTPIEKDYAKSAYHLYVVRAKQREELMAFLRERGIATGLHYPLPLHLQEAYKDLSLKEGDFPISEAHAKEILSLPLFPELTDEQIRHVANSVKEFYNLRNA